LYRVVPGGATRQESVGSGLAALPEECEIVLVHDAARPAVSASLIARIIQATRACGAAVPGLPLHDTLKRAGPDGRIETTVARTGVWAVQTPQGARRADLLAAYEKLGAQIAQATDEASVLEMAGYPVYIIEGEESNLKVTRPGDLERAERILGGAMEYRSGAAVDPAHRTAASPPHPSRTQYRTGFGYDVHAFAEGRPLWLGGVRIPHPRGLAGHSDADVLLHAVCDALLGAAAMGDIGVLFPDTDAAHRDRRSVEFLEEVARRLDAAGWRIENIDVSLLAEEPRIGRFRSEMIAAITAGLHIAPEQVNIKATTSERMGFVGRREGIACWAIATITRVES
jgi:2-C-methyl-D-erythritol 2,4-cyclodiphosphate synthase